MNERHDDLQEIIDAALREMAAEEGDGFDPQACNLTEFCRRTGLTRSRARTVGPGGIGKTHLAQAYGRECRMRGLKTYHIKATELGDRFQKAVQRGNTSRVVSSLVKPSCPIVDEAGRCVYDRPCTDLFFDVVDRRYEKEGPNATLLTGNIAPSGWDEFFTGDDTLLCALDRLFDKASAFVMRGPSYRGRGLDAYSVEAVPQAVKVRGIQPEGM